MLLKDQVALITGSGGNVRAAVWRDPEHLKYLGEGGLRVGLGLCRGKSRDAGADAGHSRGRSAKRGTRECYLPRTGNGNADVEGPGRRARKENGCERG